MKVNPKSRRFVILLAGGSGTRFWPQSRTLEPKQFLSLHRDKSLFEQTILRVKPLVPPQHIYIATSELYKNHIVEILPQYGIPADNLILEPDSRNTAASIAVSVQLIHTAEPLARVAVLPCDHHFEQDRSFRKLLEEAFVHCRDNLIVFGIAPFRPATGYGYIKTKKKCGHFFAVDRFCEKPDIKTARKFLKDGRYYWNSGIFTASAEVFLDEFKEHLPAIYANTLRIGKNGDIKGVWPAMQAISFDYGILEKSRRLLMLSAPKNLGWSDLGSWQAWDELLPKDKQGNKFLAEVMDIGSRNITVVGAKRLVATIGLEDLIVVDTPDALLITKKEKSEEVKKVVEALKKQKREEHYLHKTVRRPWGSYTVLDTGMGFKVKLVEVKPGHSLSFQLHKQRSEHW
ncbi:MAG: sugar phosphate nucleotidyltransferase, partial [Candidatus Omnitrophota bacterium]